MNLHTLANDVASTIWNSDIFYNCITCLTMITSQNLQHISHSPWSMMLQSAAQFVL